MTKPTNTSLQNQIKSLEKKGDRQHTSVLAKITKLEKKVMDAIKPFENYLVGQDAIEKNDEKNSRKPNGLNGSKAITIPEKVWDVVKLLIVIIAVLLGVKLQ